MAEVIFEKGKISKGSLHRRIKEIETDAEAEEELTVLRDYAALLEKEADTNREIKEAKKALDKKVDALYKALKEEEIKTLVVEEKWMSALSRILNTVYHCGLSLHAICIFRNFYSRLTLIQ